MQNSWVSFHLEVAFGRLCGTRATRLSTRAHLQVAVHDVMLVEVTDALQDLVDALTGGSREDME